jgi:two-component system NarL family sensor kinase
MHKNKIVRIVLPLMSIFTKRVSAQDVDSITRQIDKMILSATGLKKISSQDSSNIKGILSEVTKQGESNPDASLPHILKALNLSIQIQSLQYTSLALELLGNYFISREAYKKAITCYITCSKIEEKRKDERRIADLDADLATVYYHMEVFDKSLRYSENALAIYRRYNDSLNITRVLSDLGSLHSSREYCEKRTEEQKLSDFSIAIGYFEESVKLCIQLKNESGVAKGYQNIAAVNNKLKKPEKALEYVQKSLEIFKRQKNPDAIAGALYTMGKTYFRLNNYSKSITCYTESEEIAKKNNLTGGIQYLYEAMAQAYSESGKYKPAYEYYLKYMTLRDSVYNSEKSKQILEFETKYQTEKKEKEIIKLTSEKREKNFLLYSLTGLIIILSVLGYFIFKNISHKKLIAEQTIEIKEQHIQELEKERQLIATKSVLKGEESERSRMARDLHDGLGGLLSGVKINLSSMKGNSIITSENAATFDHAIRLLDTSISELRRVAHNLMPETLNRYGLKTALNDFVTEMSTKLTPVLSFRFFGDDVRYQTQLELTMYRIAQELVNNALKHSAATSICVQLIAETDRVCVQVVDNGKGFDTSGKSGDGKGLISIRDRVTANNGRFELESTPGEGTEATVEFLLS